jgi:hypothetical protein
VSIKIGGKRDGAVPKNVLNRAQWYLLGEHQAGGAMPEIVKTNIEQFSLDEDALEIVVQTVRLVRRSYPAREHKRAVLPSRTSGEPFLKLADLVSLERPNGGIARVFALAALAGLFGWS